MQVPITAIIVKERVRKDLGDLDPLMKSMHKYGQFSPLLLTRKLELVAGHRRLTAARQLGWKSVEVLCIDRNTDAERLEIELQENVYRKDFSAEELLEGYRRLEKLLQPSFFSRVRAFFRRFTDWLFRRDRKQGKTQSPEPVPESPGQTAPDDSKAPDVVTAVDSDEWQDRNLGV